jgi:hypothetical protein
MTAWISDMPHTPFTEESFLRKTPEKSVSLEEGKSKSEFCPGGAG